MPAVTFPDGSPVPTLLVVNATHSNLILGLQGLGSFGPPQNDFTRMPFGGTDFTTAQIQPLADWINAACPDKVVGAETVTSS